MSVITPMTSGDIDAVVAIEQVSFPVPWTADMFAAELRHAFSRCRVVRAEEDGPLAGYIVFWLTGDEVQLHDVAVAPAARGKGLGDALVAQMLAEGRAGGATRAFLEVRVSNAPAIALYRRAGFEVIGKRRAYYQDNDEDALVMGADVLPPVTSDAAEGAP